MGYSEVVCHICGVSFNIARIRAAGEPRKAAWARYGSGSFGESPSYVDGHRSRYSGKCSRGARCGFVFRGAKDRGIGFAVDERGRRCLDPDNVIEHASFEHIELEGDADGDEDYVYASPDEDALEYDSDAEGEGECDADGDVGMEDAGDAHESPDVKMNDILGPEDPGYRRFWYDALVQDHEGRKSLRYESDNYQSWYNGRQSWAMKYSELVDPDDTVFPLYYPHPDGDDASEDGSDGSFVLREPKARAGHVMTDEEIKDDEGFQRSRHRDHGKLGYDTECASEVEHIAGHGCNLRDGYNGNKITADEMQGCLTSQCLVRKPPPGSMLRYSPEFDDEDFERDGDFFLSGLSDRMPSRDNNSPQVYPPRHGCASPHAENIMWDEDRAQEFAMPFHPACLEVFTYASRSRSPGGKHEPDIEGLTSWWSMEAEYDIFHVEDCHYKNEDVNACAEQDWAHRTGTEWLAANPLFVPSVPDIFASVIETDPSFDPHDGAFTLLASTSSDESTSQATTTTTTDLFTTLPHEVLLQILERLPSPSIASLRLSTRSCTQLPISFFQHLLNRELPWLWEARPHSQHPPTPYSLWASTTATALKSHSGTLDRQLRDTEAYISIVRAEMPELLPQLLPLQEQLNEQFILEDQAKRYGVLSRSPFHLPQGKTNWFKLYTLLARALRTGEGGKKDLKGLHNRARIWKCCEEIMNRIERYRTEAEEGKIEFPVRDVRAVVLRNKEAARAKREAWEQMRREERERQREAREKAGRVGA